MRDIKHTALLEHLQNYDIITFAVFDTLITRCVTKPTDVFAIVETKAKNDHIIDRPFFQERQSAEQTGSLRYGDSNSINTIYALLAEEYGYSAEQCRYLMNTEIDTEYEVVTARSPMLELVQNLISEGKRVLLCSDTYLDSAEIRRLLTKCGYPEDLELWVSNEKGASKHAGTIWQKLFDYLPKEKKFIHIGDDELSDYAGLKQQGKPAVLIDSGMCAFKKSELYPYLSRYLNDGIGSSLMLGYLINKACFNSPFTDDAVEENVVAAWLGPVFACFMDWLVQNADDSILLFVTREGYLLQRLYLSYCSALGVSEQRNSLFFASRSATLAATATSKEGIRQITRFEYEGSLAHFLSTRLNYKIPGELEVGKERITLPRDSKRVLKLLEPYFDEIILNGMMQNDAYQSYVDAICKGKDEKLTIVDVGYSGTIQYALSSILSKKVGGLYMFLNEKKVFRRAGCTAKSFRKATVDICPIYNNLLFLEAAMQAPYGQLQRMKMVDNEIVPEFNKDINCSPFIPIAQSYYCEFVEWIGEWKKRIGSDFDLNFELAEKIWICLLKFNLLPMVLQSSFWLADDFAGNPIWRYDSSVQQWYSNNNKVPLRFHLLKEDDQPRRSEQVKLFVKKYIPDWAYVRARYLWRLCLKERKGRS